MKKELKKYFSKLGKKGYKALKENKPENYFSEIGKNGAKKRWAKLGITPLDK